MSRIVRRRFFARGLVAILSTAMVLAAAAFIGAANEPKHVTIVLSNDTMGTVLPCG